MCYPLAGGCQLQQHNLTKFGKIWWADWSFFLQTFVKYRIHHHPNVWLYSIHQIVCQWSYIGIDNKRISPLSINQWMNPIVFQSYVYCYYIIMKVWGIFLYAWLNQAYKTIPQTFMAITFSHISSFQRQMHLVAMARIGTSRTAWACLETSQSDIQRRKKTCWFLDNICVHLNKFWTKKNIFSSGFHLFTCRKPAVDHTSATASQTNTLQW